MAFRRRKTNTRRRTTTRRRSVSGASRKRKTGARRPPAAQTIRIVLEQPQPQPMFDPANSPRQPVPTRKARF